MRLEGRFEILGVEDKVSAKGNPYTSVLVMNGTDTMTMMYTGQMDLKTMTRKQVIGKIEYKPQYKSMTLTGVSEEKA